MVFGSFTRCLVNIHAFKIYPCLIKRANLARLGWRGWLCRARQQGERSNTPLLSFWWPYLLLWKANVAENVWWSVTGARPAQRR